MKRKNFHQISWSVSPRGGGEGPKELGETPGFRLKHRAIVDYSKEKRGRKGG